MVQRNRRSLYEIINGVPFHKRSSHLFLSLLSDNDGDEDSESSTKLKMFCIRFCDQIKTKWDQCKRNKTFFEKKFQKWLDDFPKIPTLEDRPHKTRMGRERKKFDDLQERSKRQRTEELRAGHTSAELLFAAKLNFRAEGNSQVSNVLAKIIDSPDAVLDASTSCPKNSLTPEEALNFLVEVGLSKQKYQLVRNTVGDILPPYNLVREAKEDCYPPASDLKISDISAEISLQGLADHTARRLLSSLSEEIINIPDEVLNSFVIMFKWGFDGSGSQANYNQRFADGASNDSSVFFTSAVPMRVFYYNKNQDKVVLWKNPTPGSTRYCRPVKLFYQKESNELVKKTEKDMQEQISSLEPFSVSLSNGKSVKSTYIFLQTMVDGKICGILTDTGSQRCHICKATPSKMNDKEWCLNRAIDEEALRFGISPLHFKLRALSFILNIAYRLDICTWRVTDPNEQLVMAARTFMVRQAVWEKMHVKVDVPRQGGGTSNTGNVARIFFSNPKLTSECTGVNEEFIRSISVLERALSSSREINADAFDEKALQTFDLFLSLYPWYYLPPTIHKVLIHGAKVIRWALCPLGDLSEEAAEARNKDVRNFRLNFSRQCDRVKTMEDLLKRLLLTSDPVISLSRRTIKRKKKIESPFEKDIQELMVCPNSESYEEVCNIEEDSD